MAIKIQFACRPTVSASVCRFVSVEKETPTEIRVLVPKKNKSLFWGVYSRKRQKREEQCDLNKVIQQGDGWLRNQTHVSWAVVQDAFQWTIPFVWDALLKTVVPITAVILSYLFICMLGNGPSGICLSYLLSGYIPYVSRDSVHPHPILQRKLQELPEVSILDQVCIKW